MQDSLHNGTTATYRPMTRDDAANLRTLEYIRSFIAAPTLMLEQLDFNDDEAMLFAECLEHTVLRIVIHNGGPLFRKHLPKLRETLPASKFRTKLEKTVLFSLPAMPIDESSTTGNADVLTAMLSELHLDSSKKDFIETIRLVAGDQLSMARLRSIALIRAGHEGDGESLPWLIKVPGLFHYKINATHGVLLTHLGEPNHDISNPASLAAHNTVLHRKHITASSPPNFRTSRNLVNVSLYARVLHCMLKVSSYVSLEDYAKNVSWDEMQAHAKLIIGKFANANEVEELREKGKRNKLEGDALFENASLFLRDALILREFTDAIKVGDTGRVVAVLKLWVHAFRGSGKVKYAQEAMEFIHNISCVWTEEQRYASRTNSESIKIQ